MRPIVPSPICPVAVLVTRAPFENAFWISFEDADALRCHKCSSSKRILAPIWVSPSITDLIFPPCNSCSSSLKRNRILFPFYSSWSFPSFGSYDYVIPIPKENQDARETVSVLWKIPYSQSESEEAEKDLWVSLLPESAKQREQCPMETGSSW